MESLGGLKAFSAYNCFHHGGNVNAQDQQLHLDCVAAGQALGQPMKALQALVERITAHRFRGETSL